MKTVASVRKDMESNWCRRVGLAGCASKSLCMIGRV
jgi:hypothetical protein